jgi:hypothetical protein
MSSGISIRHGAQPAYQKFITVITPSSCVLEIASPLSVTPDQMAAFGLEPIANSVTVPSPAM